MIKISLLKGGKTESGTLNDLSDTKSFVWADCLNPTEAELKRISELLLVPIEELRDSIDESERPRVVASDSYGTIIFSAPVTSGRKLTITAAVSIFIFGNTLVTLRNREIPAFSKIDAMNDEMKKNTFSSGVSRLVYVILEHVIDDYFSVMDDIEEKIHNIEDKIFSNPEDKFAKEIFALKKTLIYFHKSLSANREVITALERESLKQIDKKELKRFRNLYNDITELIDLEGIYMDIMTGALDIYLTSVSNNLNNVMKKMTAMGSFILIPTLISGIYGMNFKFFPETDWKYGYAFALGLMVFSVVSLYIYFKRKKWL